MAESEKIMKKRGLLVVLSGPAGSGKSTLAEYLIKSEAGKVCRSVTATTRQPRPGEKEGRDYYFLSKDEFKQGLSEGRFVEYTEFNGQFYGSLKSDLERLLNLGRIVLLVIDVEGSSQIRESFPNAIHIFVLPPTQEELRHRLCGRGTETEEDINRRLLIAEKEIERIKTYNYLVINDCGKKAVKELHEIIHVAHTYSIRGDECEAWLAGAYKA